MEHESLTTPCRQIWAWFFVPLSLGVFPSALFLHQCSTASCFSAILPFSSLWGSKSETGLLMLLGAFFRVWPIQPFFFQNLPAYPHRFQSSSLWIFSSHQMLDIHLRQLFMNVWFFYSAFLSISMSLINKGELILHSRISWVLLKAGQQPGFPRPVARAPLTS